ncbi:MAG: hypothetical protein ABI210_06925 [Abditibacteriaceae bacterium]
MKRFSLVPLCVVAFAAALLCVKPHSLFAQQFPPNEWRQIRVHYVRPDMLAYLIDPEHQKEPLEPHNTSLNDPIYSSQSFQNDMKSGAPKLTFDGVLAVDNSQNALWVLSSQKTFDQTKSFVNFLDHPIPQAELELQVVIVSKEDLKSFEIKPIQPVLNNPSQHFPYKFSALTADSRIALQEFVTQGKAKLINSPRITTLNHLTGSLTSATTTPIFVGIKNLNEPYVPLTFDSENDYHIGQTKQLRTAFTPSINEAAKTISIDLDVSADEGLTKYNANPKDTFSRHDKTILFRNQLNPPLVAKINVDDNQLILITGLDTTMLGIDEKHDNVAIFLSARILHRTNDL